MSYTNTLRKRLVNFARRYHPQAAEDLAQDALLETWAAKAEEPVAFAFGVLKKRIARAYRIPQRSLLAEVERPLPCSDEILDTAHKFGRLDAAMENVLLWGGTGSTGLRVNSLGNVRIIGIFTEYSAARAVFNELQYDQRHIRRLRKKFDTELAQAFARSACVIGSDPEPAMIAAAPPDDSEEDAGGASEHTVHAAMFLDPVLERAFWTAQRYARSLSLHGCLEVATAALTRGLRTP